MAVTKTKRGFLAMFVANPMIAKLDRVAENDEPSLTTKGIAKKHFSYYY